VSKLQVLAGIFVFFYFLQLMAGLAERAPSEAATPLRVTEVPRGHYLRNFTIVD
jgi:hypothetical protein